MIDQNTTLKFEIYDQLSSWYRIWYSYSSTMGRVSDEYQRTGNIHDPIITKDDLEHLATIRENIEEVYYDGLFLKEVEQNLLSMDTPNKGVFYLNKLVKLINPFIVYNSGKYLEYTCNTRLLGSIETVDSKAIDAFLFEVQQFATSFSYIEDTIVKLLSESVWYQQYISLIKVEGYKNGVSVANDLNKLSATALPNKEPEPMEPGVKLQWNGNKRALYDLFAQLTLIDVEPGKGLIGNSIKDLARFLSNNVEGFATANTIERELEKMREPQGIEKAKRGRIQLNITRSND
ncbi:hypothetical protein [Spirosoma linguale]|uniref:Uncharacterized protein n=1 Tax=Spirosoma linguale (strain ATCC 33905 / DSM 74 / LMG 10896 / Claus 1) TaxID=504472 RepID=D2QSP9_SPILD|nr:hypothetical protein Slin_5867 [Spirosoma linguale DSM 74]